MPTGLEPPRATCRPAAPVPPCPLPVRVGREAAHAAGKRHAALFASSDLASASTGWPRHAYMHAPMPTARLHIHMYMHAYMALATGRSSWEPGRCVPVPVPAGVGRARAAGARRAVPQISEAIPDGSEMRRLPGLACPPPPSPFPSPGKMAMYVAAEVGLAPASPTSPPNMGVPPPSALIQLGPPWGDKTMRHGLGPRPRPFWRVSLARLPAPARLSVSFGPLERAAGLLTCEQVI